MGGGLSSTARRGASKHNGEGATDHANGGGHGIGGLFGRRKSKVHSSSSSPQHASSPYDTGDGDDATITTSQHQPTDETQFSTLPSTPTRPPRRLTPLASATRSAPASPSDAMKPLSPRTWRRQTQEAEQEHKQALRDQEARHRREVTALRKEMEEAQLLQGQLARAADKKLLEAQAERHAREVEDMRAAFGEAAALQAQLEEEEEEAVWEHAAMASDTEASFRDEIELVRGEMAFLIEEQERLAQQEQGRIEELVAEVERQKVRHNVEMEAEVARRTRAEAEVARLTIAAGEEAVHRAAMQVESAAEAAMQAEAFFHKRLEAAAHRVVSQANDDDVRLEVQARRHGEDVRRMFAEMEELEDMIAREEESGVENVQARVAAQVKRHGNDVRRMFAEMEEMERLVRHEEESGREIVRGLVARAIMNVISSIEREEAETEAAAAAEMAAAAARLAAEEDMRASAAADAREAQAIISGASARETELVRLLREEREHAARLNAALEETSKRAADALLARGSDDAAAAAWQSLEQALVLRNAEADRRVEDERAFAVAAIAEAEARHKESAERLAADLAQAKLAKHKEEAQGATEARDREAALRLEAQDGEKMAIAKLAESESRAENAEAEVARLKAELASSEAAVAAAAAAPDANAAALAESEAARSRERSAAAAIAAKMRGTAESMRLWMERTRAEVSSFQRGLKLQLAGSLEWMGRASKSLSTKNAELARGLAKAYQERARLNNELIDMKGRIRVFARVRPMVGDAENGATPAVHVPNPGEVSVMLPAKAKLGGSSATGKLRPQTFAVDQALDAKCGQQVVYAEVAPLVHASLDGYNSCVIAYGQTGAGKTFTMEGVEGDRGVVWLAMNTLFARASEAAADLTYTFEVSILEVYNDTLRDLGVLETKPLGPGEQRQTLDVRLLPDGTTHVAGLSRHKVANTLDVAKLLRRAMSVRAQGATNINERSSRSHLVLTVHIACVPSHNVGRARVTKSKLVLVDLAGSERLGKSGSTGERLLEAQHINRSLSLLGSCISALRAKSRRVSRRAASLSNQPATDDSHIPFRDCRLTFVLSDSLGGDSKTLLLLHCAPTLAHSQESACTLAFGVRARGVSLGPATRQVSAAAKNSPYNISLPKPAGSPPLRTADADAVSAISEKLRESESNISRIREESARAYEL
ncbi:hypothetical protein PPROV_000241000 [Pycnococcus provasolii]|uniref:Kinesin motor domain-containing protein n=1 Tax=Pycnococcus provasolii TaxID=41880 RepID=A0A830H9K0_9CHLO|nr:hypothetical protein PPROV_000241000 [Pycnococcus provasolii]